MIKDLIVSFKDNFNDKIKNPFLGTYFLVWLIRNWDLIFTLFNFNKGTTLENKISIIVSYLNSNPFFGGLVINVGFTFLFLIITYVLLNISRAIVNLFEKQLKPWVYKLTDKSSIVLKEDFEFVKSERDNLLIRISDERDSKSRVELELKKLQDKEKESNLIKAQVTKTQAPVDRLSEMEALRRDLLNEDLLDEFREVLVKIRKNTPFHERDKTVDPFVFRNLIKYKSTNKLFQTIYELTELGETFSDYLNLK
jgi:hypothetical protein